MKGLLRDVDRVLTLRRSVGVGATSRGPRRLKDPARGLVLKVEGGGVCALDADPEARRLFGARVLVEGVRSGYDRLDVG